MTIDVFAELGVLVLLFVVGTHLSLRAFRNIYRLAVGAAALQILVSVSVMLALAAAARLARRSARCSMASCWR